MKAIGVIIIILALVVGIVPQLTQCQSQGREPLALANGGTTAMKCHWTAQSELSLAFPLLIVGGATSFSRRKETRRVLAILGVVLGALVIALPTYLIGVCKSLDMLCNSLMQPVLILSGIIVIVASLASLVLSERSKEKGLPE
jgi:hypothetical protein